MNNINVDEKANEKVENNLKEEKGLNEKNTTDAKKKSKKISDDKINNEKLKKNINNVNKRLKEDTNEFKEFIMKGNIVDLAVGVVVGGAFSKIVTSLVNDILMPVIGILIGGIDFSDLNFTFLNAKIQYGMFIQQIIDFLIISASIFAFLKVFSRITGVARKNKEKEEEKAKQENIEKSNEEKLLEEIRDLIRENGKK